MDEEKIIQLRQEIADLKEKLKEREDSLPVHSASALQFQQLEELEEAIEEKEKLLKNLERDMLTG